MVVQAYNPKTGNQRQEDFQNSRGYIDNPRTALDTQ